MVIKRIMSDTQFSSLSPNSSNDLEVGNLYMEENDLYDQETLSITSDKSVANLLDFYDSNTFKIKVDPFLSDFMKEEKEDKSWFDSCPDSSEMNVFLSSMSTENDIEDYLSVATNGFEGVENDLLDWDASSTTNILSNQRSNSNKRAFSPIDNVEYSNLPLPTKQRRVEVFSHIRCDEWINKYHEIPERFSFKDSGMLDRRKTKHHKVLRECDMELQIQTLDYKRNKGSFHLQKHSPFLPNTLVKYSSQNFNNTVSISPFPNKLPVFRTVSLNQNVQRNPIDTDIKIEPYIKKEPQTESHTDHHIPSKHSSSNHNPNTILNELEETVEMPRMPAPLRMGKRISRRGHRFSLWQFLMCLLDSNKYREHNTGIRWINRNNGVFHIIDSKQVATLWGQYKERREKMTYDSLARSLRHYYKKNLMAKINNRRLVYQIAQECIQWSSECFLKRNKE